MSDRRMATTMIVIIDGKEEQRWVECYNKEFHRYEPLLHDDEIAVWTIGDYRPRIVKRGEG